MQPASLAAGEELPELGLKANDCTEMTWLESALFMNGMSDKGIEALLNRTPEFNSSFKAKLDFVTKSITEKQWEEIWRALRDLKEEEANITLIMEPFGGRMSEKAESPSLTGKGTYTTFNTSQGGSGQMSNRTRSN